MEHTLKIWPEYFQDIWSGKKTFEVRKNDRDFKKFDVLILKEWDFETNKYTGSYIYVDVVYVLHGGQFGIKKGYCVMGIKKQWR